jgi:hypothetical protein
MPCVYLPGPAPAVTVANIYVCVECVPYLFLIKGTLFDLGKKSRKMWERQREEEEISRKGDVGVGGVYI